MLSIPGDRGLTRTPRDSQNEAGIDDILRISMTTMSTNKITRIFAAFALTGLLGASAADTAQPQAPSSTTTQPATKPTPKATPFPRKPQDAITPWDPGNNPRQKAFLDRARDKDIQLVFL